jgi:hypothetical protein
MNTFDFGKAFKFKVGDIVEYKLSLRCVDYLGEFFEAGHIGIYRISKLLAMVSEDFKVESCYLLANGIRISEDQIICKREV